MNYGTTATAHTGGGIPAVQLGALAPVAQGPDSRNLAALYLASLTAGGRVDVHTSIQLP